MRHSLPRLRGRAVSGVGSQLHRELARLDLKVPVLKHPSVHHQDLIFKHLCALPGA